MEIKPDPTTLEYKLTADDFLNLQLYHVSTDEAARKQRKKEKYRILGLSVLCGLILLFEGDYQLYSYFFLGSALLFFLIYPWWSAWFYKRMYKRQIAETLKGSFPHTTKLLLDTDVIDVDTKNGYSRFTIHDVKSITETGTYFFITMSQFITVIIPKNRKDNTKTEEIENLLRSYEADYKVPYDKNKDWKWK
jgi:hypothetical protein